MKFVNVFNASGLLEAESIHLFLESAGIISFVSQESAGVSLGLTFGPLGQAKVLVNEAQVNEAFELLKKMEEGDFINSDELDNTNGKDLCAGDTVDEEEGDD